MNHNKHKVFDNTALVPLTRKLFTGETVPTTERWTHAEGENLPTGKVAYERKRISIGDVSAWATATSKPFGTPLKPKRPNEDVRFAKGEGSKPITSIRALREAQERLASLKPATQERIVCADSEPVNVQEIMMERAAKCVAISARITDAFAAKRLKVNAPQRVITKKKAYKPGVTGLDKVRSVKAPPMESWEREKQYRSDLMVYALLIRSIYRMIYGG